jgi:hypothetical protein
MRNTYSVAIFGYRMSVYLISFCFADHFLRVFGGGGARLTCMHTCSSAFFHVLMSYSSLIPLPTPLVSLLPDIFTDTTP